MSHAWILKKKRADIADAFAASAAISKSSISSPMYMNPDMTSVNSKPSLEPAWASLIIAKALR